jgi:hypothetical protein
VTVAPMSVSSTIVAGSVQAASVVDKVIADRVRFWAQVDDVGRGRPVQAAAPALLARL